MLLFICLYLIVFFVLPCTKQEVAEYYGVCRKTLNKWVRCFTRLNYQTWIKLKKLRGIHFYQVLMELGSPAEHACLTKTDLIDHCDTTYHALRNMVAKFPDKFGFNSECYSEVDKFPPRISKQLVIGMG